MCSYLQQLHSQTWANVLLSGVTFDAKTSKRLSKALGSFGPRKRSSYNKRQSYVRVGSKNPAEISVPITSSRSVRLPSDDDPTHIPVAAVLDFQRFVSDSGRLSVEFDEERYRTEKPHGSMTRWASFALVLEVHALQFRAEVGHTEVTALNASYAPPPHAGHYQFVATTTRYGTDSQTACGLDSGALVRGTGYLAVASAQAMQNGCCRCNRNGGGGQTAGMGCGACGKGRFIRQLPRGFKKPGPARRTCVARQFRCILH
eukprot:Skav211643  [mRNA]  locus=scaffold1290:52575:60776:- [translate_table: standard]